MAQPVPRLARGEVIQGPVSGGNMSEFSDWVRRETGLNISDYQSLHEWSIRDTDLFWSMLGRWLKISWVREPSATRREPQATILDQRWWPGGLINYVDRVRDMGRGREATRAIIGVSQSRDRVELTWGQLFALVVQQREILRSRGVRAGDRVVALLPNVPETLVVFLAAASLGAIFSSCPPEFGADAVISRFGQISPKLLVYADEYVFGSKRIYRRALVEQIVASLPSLATTTRINVTRPFEAPGSMSADDLTTDALDAEHPLYVLYSSGTTGQPKGIVHGHAGIVHEHSKMLSLHHNLGPGDRLMWYSTTGWMMWNYSISGLLVGATVVLFDGDPAYPDLSTLWKLAERERLTMLGVGAPFLHACAKAQLSPRRQHDLSSLRVVGSTGSPLLASGFRWVRDEVGPEVAVHSISGGTDVCTAFLAMTPTLPIRAGEIACAALGADVQAWREDGSRCQPGETGELVIAAAMPTMPISFWDDPERSRLAAAYFARFPGVWRHGDWITFFEDGMSVVGGRSDATLNRGGVRSGTSEFYGVVEALAFVADSLIVHLADRDGPEGRLILFVQLRDGDLDDERCDQIRSVLRTKISPRHVPDEIRRVRVVPRTLSGKKLEIPVKRVLQGAAIDEVCSRSSLADPTALDDFVSLRDGD
jgi:acetoacetyl-CoA synthetase